MPPVTPGRYPTRPKTGPGRADPTRTSDMRTKYDEFFNAFPQPHRPTRFRIPTTPAIHKFITELGLIKKDKIPTSEWAYPDEIFEAAMTGIKNWDEHRYYTIQAKWIKTCTSYKPIFGFSNVVKRLKAYGRFQLSRGCAPKRLLGGKTYAWIDKPTIVKFVQPESGHEKTGHWGDNLPQKTSTHANSYNKK
ncbi:hypothetical protein QL093DRAFT_2110307 [Fusarium oxysporum]|nr:hypothetical protein QL093DRAFT_2110307 [Fusarium oxysporum]